MANFVGERLRFFRKMEGLSQEALALRAGINPAFLGHLERGLKSPTITTVEKITKALNISLEELFAQEPANASEQQQALDRLIFAVRGLSAPEVEQVANIVQKIVELRS